MSLANTLLNGGTYSLDVTVEASKYSHSNGATRIAMESVAELHDIFMESFYNTNQAELAAATEGVALEGSQYQAVYEAAIGNAVTKVKEFFKKLWAKVKAFFHNVKRFLDSIFMSGAEFVKKYDKDIRGIGTLKDFEYKMYKYNNAAIDNVSGTGSTADEMADKIIDDALDVSADDIETIRKTLDRDEVAKATVIKMSGGKCKDPDDFEEFLFGMYRGGVDRNDDKEAVEVSNITEFAEILKNSGKLMGTLDKYAKRVDSAYAKAIKEIDKVESEFSKKTKEDKDFGVAAEGLRLASSAVSVWQNYKNKQINAWKAVVKERDTAYKGLIMAAFAHAKKQKKGEKK